MAKHEKAEDSDHERGGYPVGNQDDSKRGRDKTGNRDQGKHTKKDDDNK